MSWEQIERSFNRAMQEAMSKKKILFTFPFLVLCGLFFVFCQTVAMSTGHWMKLFLAFLPLFLSFGVLLAAGVVLIKVYYHEYKKTEHNFKKIIYQSYQMLLNIAYLALPFLIAYIIIWIVLGFFYLLKSIPFIGSILGPLLAFVPFILILATVLLTLAALFFLFFATPDAALKTGLKMILIRETALRLKRSIFSDFISLVVSLIPLAISFFLLYLSSVIASRVFFSEATEVIFAFESLFMMIPFCALLTPSVVFFFNFSAECFLLDQNNDQEQHT